MVSRAKYKEPDVPLGPPLPAADGMAQRMFERSASTGMVIAIVHGSESWSSGYGRVAPGEADRPGPTSLLRLCSITKILATDVLAKLVAEKEVSFDDPLQKFAPQGITVPEKTGRGPAARLVNLGDLATHTAGLPREIAYPPAGMAHFTFPDFPYRWAWLPEFRLRTSPGDAAHYSNIGFDLLADALSEAAGEEYATLFHKRTAEPLGMVDTTLSPTPEQCKRLMSGAREPSECTDTQAAAGSGGMYSTANDMVRFMRYLLYLPGVPTYQNGLSTGMYLDPAKLRSVQGLGHAGIPTGIGAGWIEINGDHGDARIVQKTGGGAGFQTYIALDPARHTGIFLALTQGRRRSAINMFHEANDLLLTMAGLPPVPPDPNDPERERTADELAEAGAASRTVWRGRGAHMPAVRSSQTTAMRSIGAIKPKPASGKPNKPKAAVNRTKTTSNRGALNRSKATVRPVRRSHYIGHNAANEP